MKYLKAHFLFLFIAYFGNLNAQNFSDSVCREYYLCDVELNQSCINYQVGDISFSTLNLDSVYATISYSSDQIKSNYFVIDTIRFPNKYTGKFIDTKHGIYKPGFYTLKIISKKNETLCVTNFIFDYCSKVTLNKDIYMKDGNFKLSNYQNITDFHFSLFNNRGLEVFKTTDPNFSWNYQYFGKEISDGEYYYSIEYNTISILSSEYKSEAGILKIYQ